jgi:hypothetical protein
MRQQLPALHSAIADSLHLGVLLPIIEILLRATVRSLDATVESRVTHSYTLQMTEFQMVLAPFLHAVIPLACELESCPQCTITSKRIPSAQRTSEVCVTPIHAPVDCSTIRVRRCRPRIGSSLRAATCEIAPKGRRIIGDWIGSPLQYLRNDQFDPWRRLNVRIDVMEII